MYIMEFYKIIIGAFLLYIVYFVIKKNFIMEKFSNYSNPTYTTNGELGVDFLKILKEYNFKETKYGEYFFPSDYNPCEKDAKKLITSPHKFLYVMDGCDIIGSKVDLWKVIKDEFTTNIATKYMPRTYLYENKQDMEDLKAKMDIDAANNVKQMYVLKNYEQRQEGIKIATSWAEIMDPDTVKKYYLIQEYFYNPYILNKRKINMRVYYLIVCRDNRVKCYIYSNGFMYYTPNFYDPDDPDFKKHITTGYIDRQVYVDNPLTHQDFRTYLGAEQSNKLDRNIKELMHFISQCLAKRTCRDNIDDKIRFQLYGVDIQPDANLDVKCIEINKGADLNSKDARDGEVKYKMQQDIFKVINSDQFGITDNFIDVY